MSVKSKKVVGNSSQIIDMYKNKKFNASEIAEIYDVSPTLILNLLREKGVKTSSHYKTRVLEEAKKDVIHMYKKGISCAKIGEVYGVSHETVRRYLVKNKISPKKYGPRNKRRTGVRTSEVILDRYDMPKDVIEEVLGKYYREEYLPKREKKEAILKIKDIIKEKNLSEDDVLDILG